MARLKAPFFGDFGKGMSVANFAKWVVGSDDMLPAAVKKRRRETHFYSNKPLRTYKNLHSQYRTNGLIKSSYSSV